VAGFRRQLAILRWLFSLALLLCVSASAQNPSVPANSSQTNNDLSLNAESLDRSIWENAKPYIDDSLPDLETAVPELQGLAPVTQDDLASILDRAGAKCADLLRRIPNLISQEDVITRQRTVSRVSQGVWREAEILETKPTRQKFEYLLIAHHEEEDVRLEEYRTDKHGRPPASGNGADAGTFAYGFINDWLRFYPGNRGESRFRYLGQQEIDGRKVFVVGFAQVPGSVKYPTQVMFGNTPVALLFQGVAWIDPSDFTILRMREDLLAPRPDVYLPYFTSKIRFGGVQIEKAASSLWLPLEVDMEWQFKGLRVQRMHTYSNFRLYKVQTRIIAAP
jgi:hypothetical protein